MPVSRLTQRTNYKHHLELNTVSCVWDSVTPNQTNSAWGSVRGQFPSKAVMRRNIKGMLTSRFDACNSILLVVLRISESTVLCLRSTCVMEWSENLSGEIKRSPEESKKKWECLLASFRRERAKMKLKQEKARALVSHKGCPGSIPGGVEHTISAFTWSTVIVPFNKHRPTRNLFACVDHTANAVANRIKGMFGALLRTVWTVCVLRPVHSASTIAQHSTHKLRIQYHLRKYTHRVVYYREKSLLRDPTNKGHFNKLMRNDAREDKGKKKTEKSVDVCKNKMTSLLAEMRREIAKINKSMSTGKVPMMFTKRLGIHLKVFSSSGIRTSLEKQPVL
ncbi:hypothetical protein PR048_005538 [Dryococelus australis]|uniref:Uncharacterized protein n=1 Tax=Dryococelus australis TaxID=614101 RepID=A0ABQ9I915_9NEOP|nr:hypothetical protein PR048_005538 [Dryococelus australis]